MFNVLSYIIGIISLVIVIPATIPFLGWANWIALPLIVIGLVIGQTLFERRRAEFLPGGSIRSRDPALAWRRDYLGLGNSQSHSLGE